jgi:hypothetical protein
MAEARVIHSVLDAADIPAMSFDHALAQIAWHYEFALGGLRIMVPSQCADDANRILNAEIPSAMGPQEELCSFCGADDVAKLYSWLSVPMIFLTPAIQLLVWRHRRHCRRCGTKWHA